MAKLSVASPLKDPESKRKDKRAATHLTTCVCCSFLPILPTPPASDLKSVLKGDHHMISKLINYSACPAHPISFIQHFPFGIHSDVFSVTSLCKWSWVRGNTELVFTFLRDFLIQQVPTPSKWVWVLVGCFIFFHKNFTSTHPETEVLTLSNCKKKRNWIVSIKFCF